MQNYLIFTDLDGTFLDHHDYSFTAANEALSRVREREIPLIIATSKTFSEVVKLQDELGICQPFIVENGAGIFIPSTSELAQEDWQRDEEKWIRVSQSKSYLESRLFLNTMKKSYGLRGFGDMDIKEVVALTGLEPEHAENARKRNFTEPFVIEDKTLISELTQKANALGFDIVQGGRFFHLITFGQDKSKAMSTLKLLYEECHQKTFTSIALGDSHNDFTMIENADHGVLIAKLDGTYASLVTENLIKSPFSGPKGWNHSILRLLNEY